MKTLALACEDNASDVLLPDPEVVYLRAQVRPQEDADVDQVGEAGQTGLCLVPTGHSGVRVHRTASRAVSLYFVLLLTLGSVNTSNCLSDAWSLVWPPCLSGACAKSHET